MASLAWLPWDYFLALPEEKPDSKVRFKAPDPPTGIDKCDTREYGDSVPERDDPWKKAQPPDPEEMIPLEPLARQMPDALADDKKNFTYVLPPKDITMNLRRLVMAWTLRFNDVLDFNLLHASLRRARGPVEWQIRIPKQYTHERPAVRYYHNNDNHDIRVEDHPGACRLPNGKTTPVHEGGENYHWLNTRPDVPKNMIDYMNTDEPMISLVVTSFFNATFVAINFPHIVADGLGIATLFEAWSAVLHQREPRPLGGMDHKDLWQSAVDKMGDPKYDPPEANVVNTPVDLRTVCRDTVFLKDREEEIRIWTNQITLQTIVIPRGCLCGIRREDQEQWNHGTGSWVESVQLYGKSLLRRTWPDQGSSENATLELRDSELLTAWISRFICHTGPGPLLIPNYTSILKSLSMRPLHYGMCDPRTAYVENLDLHTTTNIATKRFWGPVPFGIIAGWLQRSVDLQSQVPVAKALLRRTLETIAVHRQAPVLMAENTRPISVSDWTEARIYDAVDFTPAIIEPERSIEDPEDVGNGATSLQPAPAKPSPGSCVYYHTCPISPRDAEWCNSIIIHGRDQSDNYWISAWLHEKTWARIHRHVRRLRVRKFFDKYTWPLYVYPRYIQDKLSRG
ncbi:hypothetical protein F4778DRAFT_795532 [Xylariomycetidae sp. FL2044]|nr:hypothetical protein F4778DRAFT_795532 [Xylariomycetidae sp. FL2044]